MCADGTAVKSRRRDSREKEYIDTKASRSHSLSNTAWAYPSPLRWVTTARPSSGLSGVVQGGGTDAYASNHFTGIL